MFAVLHLPQFKLQAVLRHEPEAWARAVALVDPGMTTPRVIDATEPARAAGVTDGLTAPQALARCRDVAIRHRSPARESVATAAILQAAYGLSPNLEDTAPGVVTLDLRGLSALKPATSDGDPAPLLHAWAGRLRQAVANQGLDARVGIGPTPGVARHAARWGTAAAAPALAMQYGLGSAAVPAASVGVSPTGSRQAPNALNSDPYADARRGRRDADHSTRDACAPQDQPEGHASESESVSAAGVIAVVGDPAKFVAGLPVAALEPSSDVERILKQWGVHTVGEMLALGQAELAERLGLEALGLWAAASVKASRPLNLAKPPERFEESHEFEEPVETLEAVLFLLRRFVEALERRLEAFGLVAGELRLRLDLESGARVERELRLPQPTRRADILFRMLHTHLESTRTDSPVKGVELRAGPARPGQRQFGLFDAALRDPYQFQETLARLVALVGADRVGSPIREDSHRPDAFKLVPPDFEHPPDAVREPMPELLRPSPMRRLRPAVPAQVEGGNVDGSGDGGRRPAAVRCSLANGRLVVALGPWRASGGWWEQDGWQRDEWDVATRDGAVLRLVKTGDGWQVEAVLD